MQSEKHTPLRNVTPFSAVEIRKPTSRNISLRIYKWLPSRFGARGGTVGGVTALQA